MSKKSTLGLVGFGLFSAGAALTYLFRKRIFARALNLPPARYTVRVRRDMRLPMPDGVCLAQDLYLPQSQSPLPTILLRTPYRRGGAFGAPMVFIAHRFAERGYNVVCQDVRGQFGSDGDFEPFIHEQPDGQATIEWITAQPWSDGKVGMWGPSYLGYTQWAAALAAPDHVHAIVPLVTQSNMVDLAINGAALDTILRWILLVETIQAPQQPLWNRVRGVYSADWQNRQLAAGFNHLPLCTADEIVLKKQVPFFQEWVTHFGQEDDPYFSRVNLQAQVATVNAGVHLMSGWFDIFLPGLLEDYRLLQAAGKRPFLTIGPWDHFSFGRQLSTITDALAWFDTCLKGQQDRLPAHPVRLFVMGANEWRSYEQWPPPHTATRYYLQGNGQANGRLARQPLAHDPPDHYRYDPADPTPNIAGALLSNEAGQADNRPLEARPDVLTFTTPPLDTPLTIIGPVSLVLYVQSSLDYTDFFGRVCDVWADGRSLNVCDGLLRIWPGVGEPQPDGSLCLTLDLSATAYTFQRGHRLRLQVSSGAHPRIGRNLGGGEPILTATRLLPADQTIYHDPDHPAHLILPLA